MNPIIEQLLQGSMSMDTFLKILHSNQELQEYLRKLLPGDAINNPTHTFWKVFPYESLQANCFDFHRFLFWAANNGVKYGMELNIFNRLSRVYTYHYPDA